MLNKEHIDEMIAVLTKELIEKRGEGIWRGRLSSSAISTSVSVFALSMADKDLYDVQIKGGVRWLLSTMHRDGSWGDSIESRSNMTATLLSYAALFSQDAAPEEAKSFLMTRFGGISDDKIVDGVLAYYGKDLTFSAPILVMCALAGVIKSWEKIPQLPFELSVVPQRFFKFLRLPVVSYAIPALIAVGILRHRKGNVSFQNDGSLSDIENMHLKRRTGKGLFYNIRESFVEKSLRVLTKLQPSNGGFLEAAPLTAFVTMCMCGAGFREHTVTQKAVRFLTDNVRDDGAWPIDTDLACWVTALSVKALDDDVPDRVFLLEAVKKNAFTYKHPFTGAKEGGWGWNDLPGAAPDADDTSGNLIALHILNNGAYCKEAEKGVEWLLDLQNKDGGMPTFCKGWGKLPFDRSSPDISAHSLMAIELWMPVLSDGMQKKCRKGIIRLLKWMKKTQATDGSWTPLWFGDQDASDERSPVYGTAVVVEQLGISEHPVALNISAKGIRFLLDAQNEDGGWGGAKGLPSKVTLTSKALSALTSCSDIMNETGIEDGRESICDTEHINNCMKAIEEGVDYLYKLFSDGKINRPEPIGLYFSRLWYSEELYNLTFVLSALRNIRKIIEYADV